MSGAPDAGEADSALDAAVARLIAEAKGRGAVVRTGEYAKRLALEMPDCGRSPRELAQVIARQAVAAGVPIQFTSPD